MGRAALGAGIVATFGAAWVLQEFFRTIVYKGFPWNLSAHPLDRHPPAAQTAALGGVFRSSCLVASLNAALFVALTRPARDLRLAWLAGTTLAAVVAGAAARGTRARPRSC